MPLAQITKQGYRIPFRSRHRHVRCFPSRSGRTRQPTCPAKPTAPTQPRPTAPGAIRAAALTADLSDSTNPGSTRLGAGAIQNFRSEGQFMPLSVGDRSCLSRLRWRRRVGRNGGGSASGHPVHQLQRHRLDGQPGGERCRRRSVRLHLSVAMRGLSRRRQERVAAGISLAHWIGERLTPRRSRM